MEVVSWDQDITLTVSIQTFPHPICILLQNCKAKELFNDFATAWIYGTNFVRIRKKYSDLEHTLMIIKYNFFSFFLSFLRTMPTLLYIKSGFQWFSFQSGMQKVWDHHSGFYKKQKKLNKPIINNSSLMPQTTEVTEQTTNLKSGKAGEYIQSQLIRNRSCCWRLLGTLKGWLNNG